MNNAQFGFSTIVQLKGIGYLFCQTKNHISLNVGLSHLIHYKVPENIICLISGKKFNYLKVYGTLGYFVNDYASKIILLRKPNIYTGKGLYWKRQVLFFKLKVGKIKKI